ncbi:MAG: hypothetical protein AVDCRST_MAG56-6995, partial [uncultured Cytophagales bacterium]
CPKITKKGRKGPAKAGCCYEENRKGCKGDAWRTRISLRPLRLYCDPCGSVRA